MEKVSQRKRGSGGGGGGGLKKKEKKGRKEGRKNPRDDRTVECFSRVGWNRDTGSRIGGGGGGGGEAGELSTTINARML